MVAHAGCEGSPTLTQGRVWLPNHREGHVRVNIVANIVGPSICITLQLTVLIRVLTACPVVPTHPLSRIPLVAVVTLLAAFVVHGCPLWLGGSGADSVPDMLGEV